MFRTSFGALRPNVRTITDGEQQGGENEGEQAQQGQQEQQQTGDQQGQQQTAEKVEDLPDWAQRIIRDTRAEAANHRTKATSAEQQLTQLRDGAAVALGLKQGETPSADELATKLTAAQAAQRDTAIQLAVYRAAKQHQGNPDALLDSNTFLASVKALDPTSSDFNTQVSDAIKTAVTSNTTLRLVQATGSSAADHAGGTGEPGTAPITEAQLNAASPEQIDKWFEAGRLDHLLGNPKK